MAVDWSRPLTRVLTLKSGERLRTLHDAAELFSRRFGSVTQSASLEHAIARLLHAAETGTKADRKAATDQVAVDLRTNNMAGRLYRRRRLDPPSPPGRLHLSDRLRRPCSPWCNGRR
jgi:hypothetical protein